MRQRREQQRRTACVAAAAARGRRLHFTRLQMSCAAKRAEPPAKMAVTGQEAKKGASVCVVELLRSQRRAWRGRRGIYCRFVHGRSRSRLRLLRFEAEAVFACYVTEMLRATPQRTQTLSNLPGGSGHLPGGSLRPLNANLATSLTHSALEAFRALP